jgi:hypothetical protein
MGASPSIGLPDLGSLTNKGASIRKRVPIVGRCLSPFLPRILGAPDLTGYRGSSGDANLLR